MGGGTRARRRFMKPDPETRRSESARQRANFQNFKIFEIAPPPGNHFGGIRVREPRRQWPASPVHRVLNILIFDFLIAYVIVIESGARASDTIRFASTFFSSDPTLFTPSCPGFKFATITTNWHIHYCEHSSRYIRGQCLTFVT